MIDAKQLLSMMVGGSEEQFLREYWRKRTLFAEGRVPQLEHYYSVAQFIADYRMLDYHSATYIISISQEGVRNFVTPRDWVSVESALKQGIPMALLTMNIPKRIPRRPAKWDQLISFHQSLCEHLCRDFPAPPRGLAHDYFATASVDLFYASATCQETTTGGHYDTGDVFYFVLDGSKEWVVELCPDLETTKSLQMLPGGMGNLSSVDRQPLRDLMKVTLTPGDCLYVPPYTYHRVSSKGTSLAVSIGLPTFNEVTLFAYHLLQLQFKQGLYNPLPSFPHTHEELSSEARRETQDRMMRVLSTLAETFR